MIRTTTWLLLLGFLFAVLFVPVASAAGLRTIGLRFLLPWTDVPFLIGVEASADVKFGIATGAFFLNSDGGTLILASGDLRLSDDTTGLGGTYVRITAGLFYFDTSQFLPSPVIGGGVSYQVPVAGSLSIGLAAELLYPLALRAPMVAASAGWIVP